MHFLTTRQCADLLNDALDMPGVFRDYFIRGEISDGRLEAALREPRGESHRLVIRIHPKALVRYCQQHYPRIADVVREKLRVAA